jgi:hypothetical protein
MESVPATLAAAGAAVAAVRVVVVVVAVVAMKTNKSKKVDEHIDIMNVVILAEGSVFYDDSVFD